MTPSLARAFGGPTEALAGYLVAGTGAGIMGAVLAPGCSDDDLSAFRARVRDMVEVRTFGTTGRGALTLAPRLILHVARFAQDFDVVHVHGLLNLVSSLAARAARRAGCPLVVRPFGTLSRYTFTHRRAAAKRAYFRALDDPNLRASAAIHFTTTAERDEAAWHGLELSDRSHVVPPPWEEGQRPHERRHARQSRSVLFLSRLHPKKGVEALLEAWRGVDATLPGARLVVAGDGNPRYIEALRKQARGLAGVEFVGFVAGDEKATLLNEADLLVLPSYHENFGVAVVEAIAAGLPVVLTADVQLAPWVVEEAMGVVTTREPDALARAIVAALGDRLLRERCAREGLDRVRAVFSPAVVGAGLRRLYDSAVVRGVA